jgi:ATP adenylyltransferase
MSENFDDSSMNSGLFSTGVGIPDRWQRLWAPHRSGYLAGEQRPLPSNDVPCPFCRIPAESDESGLIVHRGTLAYVVMNLFPYNPGHLLVCTYRHVADLTELSPEEREEVSDLTVRAMKTIRLVSNPDGFNLGMNQGELAGAGIAAHIHQHIVPRWKGDANFMPIIGQTKIISQLLEVSREDIASHWVNKG